MKLNESQLLALKSKAVLAAANGTQECLDGNIKNDGTPESVNTGQVPQFTSDNFTGMPIENGIRMDRHRLTSQCRAAMGLCSMGTSLKGYETLQAL